MPKLEYRLECVDRFGADVGTLSGAKLDSVTWELNGPGRINYTMSQGSPAVTLPELNKNEVQLYIDEVSDEPQFWGIHLKSREKPNTVQFEAPGLLEYFNYRFITNSSLLYTDVEQMQIAAALVQAMQAGPDQDFNIGIGSYFPSGRIRSRDYAREEHANALDILREWPEAEDALGNLTGFDFDIVIDATGRRLFTPYYPTKGVVHQDVDLEWGRNITDFEVAVDGTQMANRAYITGGSNGDIKFEENHRDDASCDEFQEWQTVEAAGGENDVNVLKERARRLVTRRKKPVRMPQLTAVEVDDELFKTFNTGDWVRVVIDRGRTQVDDFFRIQTKEWLPGPGNLKFGFAES